MKKPFKITGDEYLKNIDARAIAKLESWINHGGFLSSFWDSLLSGDYLAAACNADPENLACFGWLLRFLERTAPGGCFGSRDAVETWNGLHAQTVAVTAAGNS
jgi:hypothetical protein